MVNRIVTVLTAAFVGSVVFTACGPKCPAVLEKKTPDVMARDDVLRVNAYVEARKAAIAAAKEGNQYDVERAQFTVTACQLAVEIQMRIINLAEAGGASYEENSKGINKARCLLDEILEKKGKVVGLKIGKGIFIKKGKGGEIQKIHAAFEDKFGKEGRPRNSEIEMVLEKGMKPPKVGKKGEGDEGEEGEEGGGPDEAGDDDMGGDESLSGDEDGDEEESSGGAMDAF